MTSNYMLVSLTLNEFLHAEKGNEFESLEAKYHLRSLSVGHLYMISPSLALSESNKFTTFEKEVVLEVINS